MNRIDHLNRPFYFFRPVQRFVIVYRCTGAAIANRTKWLIELHLTRPIRPSNNVSVTNTPIHFYFITIIITIIALHLAHNSFCVEKRRRKNYSVITIIIIIISLVSLPRAYETRECKTHRANVSYYEFRPCNNIGTPRAIVIIRCRTKTF